mgnify:CR=1 FL=1
MKKIFLIAAVIASVSSIVFSQEVTDEPKKPRQMMTLTGPEHTGGGYGAFTTGYSVIQERHAYEFGFRGMWVINHSIAMGFGGTGFANQAMYNSGTGSDNFLTGGYGGFIIEPIVAPMYPVHIAFPILIGGGGISYVETDWDEFDNFVMATDFFMLIQPGAERSSVVGMIREPGRELAHPVLVFTIVRQEQVVAEGKPAHRLLFMYQIVRWHKYIPDKMSEKIIHFVIGYVRRLAARFPPHHLL